jgi:hypothetical protein
LFVLKFLFALFVGGRYAEFGSLVEDTKKVFMLNLKVKKGVSVAVIGRNSMEWAIDAYAT